jgi:aminoglycoside phosphotransferase (APT) family kinase protein
MQQPTLTSDDLPVEIRAVTGLVLRFSQIPQSSTCDIAVVEGTQGASVIKRAVHQPFRDWLRREYTVLRALALAGLPIPRVCTCLEHTTTTGVCHCMLERRAGVGHDLLFAFGQLLAPVHRCPPPCGLPTGDQSSLDGMLRRAAGYLKHYPVDDTPELLAQFEHQCPAPVPATLIHGDYTLDNVLVVQQAVTGLVDWAGGDGW